MVRKKGEKGEKGEEIASYARFLHNDNYYHLKPNSEEASKEVLKYFSSKL